MRLVPANRLLIQPTVQRQWLEQHQTIELQLSEAAQRSFQTLWTQFLHSAAANPFAFINCAAAQPYCLHEDDLNFALLVGAAHIRERYPQFTMRFFQPALVWSIVAPATTDPRSRA